MRPWRGSFFPTGALGRVLHRRCVERRGGNRGFGRLGRWIAAAFRSWASALPSHGRSVRKGGRGPTPRPRVERHSGSAWCRVVPRRTAGGRSAIIGGWAEKRVPTDGGRKERTGGTAESCAGRHVIWPAPAPDPSGKPPIARRLRSGRAAVWLRDGTACIAPWAWRLRASPPSKTSSASASPPG